MAKIQLHGRTIPRAFDLENPITYKNFLTQEIDGVKTQIPFTMVTSIKEGNIEINCETPGTLNKVDNLAVIQLAIEISTFYVDLYAFGTARYVSLVIETATFDGKKTSNFTPHSSPLRSQVKSFNPETLSPEELAKIGKFAGADFIYSLHDLVEALSLRRRDSELNAARAIEAIRHVLSPEETNKDRAWKALQKTLHVSEEYMKFVQKLAEDSRHGRRVTGSEGKRIEALRRAWIIMDRYISYCLKDNQTLSEKDFPWLE